MAKKQKPLPWIKLDENNHPPFSQEVLIWTDSGFAFQLKLTSKTTDSTGTRFVFGSKADATEVENATHYLIITEPEA